MGRQANRGAETVLADLGARHGYQRCFASARLVKGVFRIGQENRVQKRYSGGVARSKAQENRFFRRKRGIQKLHIGSVKAEEKQGFRGGEQMLLWRNFGVHIWH